MNQSHVIVLQNNHFVHLIVNPPNFQTTYVITFDSHTGSPSFSGIPLVDIFPDFFLAVSKIQESFGSKKVAEGKALLGVGTFQKVTSIWIITRTEETAIIANKYKLHTIKESSIYTIPSNEKSPFLSFPFNEHHYFCESSDFHIPFTSSSHTHRFRWNSAWIEPFRKLGIPNVCVSSFQGVCKSFLEDNFKITYISRSFPTNSGVNLSPGFPSNEIENEIIIEKDSDIQSHVWRSGSVPLRWSKILSDETREDSDESYSKKALSQTNCNSLNYIFIKSQESPNESSFFARLSSCTKHSFQEINFGNLMTINYVHQQFDELHINITFSSNSSKQSILNRFTSTDSSFISFCYALKVIESSIQKSFQEQLAPIFAFSSAIFENMLGQTFQYKKISAIDFPQFPTDIKTKTRQFMKPSSPSLRTLIDPLHISIMNKTTCNTEENSVFPEAILKIDNNMNFYQLKSTHSCDLVLCLSRPMTIREICICLAPIGPEMAPKSMIVMGGISLNDLTVYQDIGLPLVLSQKRCKYSIKTDPLRFLLLRFFGNGEKIVIGNIAIYGEHLFGNYKILPYVEKINSQQQIEEFNQAFSAFLASKRGLVDALKLKQSQIQNGIDDFIRINLAKNAGINPWITDSQALLLCCPQFCCALCGNPLKSRFEQYEVSKLIPSLFKKIREEKSGDKRSLNICSNCKEFGEEIDAFTKANEEKMIPIVYPAFKANTIYDGEQNIHLLSDSTAFILDSPLQNLFNQALIQNNDVSATSPISLRIFFIKTAIVSSIIIYHKGNLELSVKASNGSICEFLDCKNDNEKSSFEIKEPIIDNLIELTIKCDKIQLIDALGTFIDKCEVSSPEYKPIKNELPIPTPCNASWNIKQRTSTISIPTHSPCKFICIKINGDAKKLLFTFLKNDKIISWKEFILPHLKIGDIVYFPNDINQIFDSINIFYTDRLAVITPHEITFVF